MKHLFLGVLMLCGASSIGGAIHAQTMTRQGVSIPAGTALQVRTIDPIDINSAQPGARFRASLADPVTSHGAVLIPRGTPVELSAVTVKTSGTLKGRDVIDLKVDSILLNGRRYPVVTTMAESKGHKRGNRTLKGTGIGAAAGGVVGALAGGGKGALIGGLLGGGGGTAVAAATGNKRLRIPPESVFTFKLESPLWVH